MVGSVVGNYKIVDKIGEGGMGAVFKGIDLMLEREVAIKMLRPELARQPNVVERFRTEAVTLAKLNHPNVATLHSFFRQGDDFFMVMEFVRGETLDDIIRKQGAMPCDRAVQLFCMALEGIDHAHKMGIVHRDIKPANMMLTDTGSIKVMDFGIARVLGTDRLTKAGHLIGTVEYMSPEQVRGEETDARSDIYSLGILLYEMLTGRVPFNSTSEYELMRCQIEDAPTPPRALAPHIPLPVEQAIMRSLAKKRDARYQSAGEFRTMLMQKNTGAITTPLDAPRPSAGGYAAPATLGDRSTGMTPPSGEVIKATRLAGDQRSATPVSSIKETRLGGPEAVAGYAQAAPGHYATNHSVPSSPAKASFLGALSWKHFVGAGVALTAILAVAIALAVGAGRKPVVQEAPLPEQPSASPAPPSSSASTAPEAEAAPAARTAPPSTPVATTPGSLDPQQPAAPVRTRDPRASKNAAVPPTAAEVTPIPSPAPPPATPPTSPAHKPDQVVSTAPPEKKDPQKPEEKKKSGIGGFFKKVFGGGDDKNKNEKKKP
ncbi:MAG TPA: serine/threonine-protein kinase [Blastocatellia bacterium]|nr:serine/threonine-protein kinase [Blastocatellia bacterium]